jgi:hypothetical protein
MSVQCRPIWPEAWEQENPFAMGHINMFRIPRLGESTAYILSRCMQSNEQNILIRVCLFSVEIDRMKDLTLEAFNTFNFGPTRLVESTCRYTHFIKIFGSGLLIRLDGLKR